MSDLIKKLITTLVDLVLCIVVKKGKDCGACSE